MAVDPGTAQVFVSYRRNDTAFVVGHLVDSLNELVDGHRLFRDVDNIPYGIDYRDHVDAALADCVVALVVMGADWVGASTDGGRRIDEPADLVRTEVEQVLRRGIPVIPILVEGAPPIDELELPESVEALRFRNAIPLRRDPDFDVDCGRIAAALRPYLPDGDTDEPDAPSAADEAAALRLRLLTASPVELERIRYETAALEARAPADPDVMQLVDMVDRAVQGPPAPGAMSGEAARSTRRSAVFLRVAAGLLVVVVGFGVITSVVTTGDSDPGAGQRPATTISTSSSSTVLDPDRGVCDDLTSSVLRVEERAPDSVFPAGAVSVTVRIRNTGPSTVTMPPSSRVSLFDDDGLAVPIDPAGGLEGGWFRGFDLPPGTMREEQLFTGTEWLDRGATLGRLVVAGVFPVDQPFDRCTMSKLL